MSAAPPLLAQTTPEPGGPASWWSPFAEVWHQAESALGQDLLGNSYAQLLASFLVLTGTLVLRRALVSFLFARLRRVAARTASTIDDRILSGLEGPAALFALILGVFSALGFLTLPDRLEGLLIRLFQGATIVAAFWAVLRFVDLGADLLQDFSEKRELGLSNFIPLIKKAARIFLVIFGVVLVVQNLGYSVGSLLAGLGIGGLAVALAAQESLANLFGSVTIAADLPFKPGHWIKAGSLEGTVEQVGLRSTKIRTFENSVVQVPNKILAADAIENFSRRTKWRVRQVLGVTYETTPEQMEGLLADLRRLIREHPGVEPSFHAVYFDDFGASSLDLLIIYFTRSTDFHEHRRVREEINLAVLRAVAARGLSIAFPTRTIHLDGPVARRLASGPPASDAPPLA